MAHFTKINLDNIVEQVIVVNNSVMLDENGVENESKGIEFLNSIFGSAQWVQTSYNHNFRKQFAGIGYTFDKTNNVFISLKPFESWTLNENFDWVSPLPYPTNGNFYNWNEENQTWDLF